MGKKEVSRHHSEPAHHVQHHEQHSKQHTEPSKFSLFKHQVADLFKEIIEDVPEEQPEELNPEKEVETERIEHGIRITAETDAVSEKEIEEVRKVEEIADEELDEEQLKKQEREEMRGRIHDHIINNLNNAVSKWKETGDIGIHLEPPVPLKDRVKSFLLKVKEKSSPVALKLKNQIEEVAEKVSARLKKAEHSGEKIDADVVVKEEWTKVLKKLDAMSPPAERDEIEKIYKQLSGD
jgi:hypothetical protein